MKRVAVLGFALLALGVRAAHAGGGAPAPLPLPCGLPQGQPLWVDYADGQVPFWSTIFARPGIVAAASQLIVPPQLRARGAKTVYFDLYLNSRVGTPSKPADPATIVGRADKLFDAAVASSGCDHPLIAENELFGAQAPTPWTPTTARYRANVLAYLQELANRGARPFLLLSTRPYTHDDAADAWWRQVAQVADLVPEVYFAGPAVSKLGAVAGSVRLRSTMRTRMEDLIQIGVPTNRLGMMLTFSSTPGAGGREGLPLPQWLDVVKWEALAAKQVSAELRLASVWSWGWAAFSPQGADPDKPKAACTWLWARDHSLCDAPALAGSALDTSLDVGATLPRATLCVLGDARLPATEVAALARMTGDRDVAFAAAFQHLVLERTVPVTAAAVAQAVSDVVADRFAGSRSAYAAALARARVSAPLARAILGDELRRIAVEQTLGVPRPTAAELRDWYATHAAETARLVAAARPVPWLASQRRGVALAGDAPGRLFELAAGTTLVVDGVRVTALGAPAPLAAFPLALARSSVRGALVQEEKETAYETWLRRRENQALPALACRHDQQPAPAALDLTAWAPFLALP